MELFEAVGELAAEDLTENLDWQKEAPPRINPSGVIRSQAADRLPGGSPVYKREHTDPKSAKTVQPSP
jgi:hypothetical protein